MNEETNELEFPKVSQEVLDAADAALAEIRKGSFSERNLHLGKMRKCHVCGTRHRENERKCEQKFVHLFTEEDLETGELTEVYRTAIRPDIFMEEPMLADRRPTAKQVYGAAGFAKKRKNHHVNKFQNLLIAEVRRIMGAEAENIDPELPAFKELLKLARKMARNNLLKARRKARAKKFRQTDISRRINRGLLRHGFQA